MSTFMSLSTTLNIYLTRNIGTGMQYVIMEYVPFLNVRPSVNPLQGHGIHGSYSGLIPSPGHVLVINSSSATKPNPTLASKLSNRFTPLYLSQGRLGRIVHWSQSHIIWYTIYKLCSDMFHQTSGRHLSQLSNSIGTAEKVIYNHFTRAFAPARLCIPSTWRHTRLENVVTL